MINKICLRPAILAELQLVKPISPLNSHIKQVQHLPEYQQWRDLTTQAVQLINSGVMDKVVIARQTDIQLTKPLNAASLTSASKAVNRQCYHFMLSFNAQHTFYQQRLSDFIIVNFNNFILKH